VYEGQIVDGKAHGFGRMMSHSGDYYIGWLDDGKRHGFGKTVFTNGNTHEGYFKNNTFLGHE
jgi:hypothetical protein